MNCIVDKINHLLNEKRKVIVAIDGRCASGKTTLANKLSNQFSLNVIHMDDFFLRPHQRTEIRLNTPGGNSDRERLIQEVLIPLKNDNEFSYRPFLCSSMTLGDEIKVFQKRLTIIEGSYSCHPELYDYYDLHIFCDVDKSTQYERLMKRNPDKVEDFINKWIPMEEKYFDFFDIKNKCEVVKSL